MIDQETARAMLKKRMAENLVIISEYENAYEWCFGLGLKDGDGDIIPLMGDSTIRVSKETGEWD